MKILLVVLVIVLLFGGGGGYYYYGPGPGLGLVGSVLVVLLLLYVLGYLRF